MKSTTGARPMKTFAAAALCAAASLLAVTSAPAQAAPKLKLQKFSVKFSGEHGQDWKVSETDDEYEPNCILGPGAYGSSELHTYTTGAEVVTVAANRKAGVATGRAPLEAFLSHELALGSLPPADCRDVEYKQLQSLKDCSPVAGWNKTHPWRPANVWFTVARGKVGVEVELADENFVIENDLPHCPGAGYEETKIEGTKKINAKKLFAGKPQTIKFHARHDYPAPEHHDVEGFYEWTLTIKALPPKKHR
jgi:hypothetical protein